MPHSKIITQKKAKTTDAANQNDGMEIEMAREKSNFTKKLIRLVLPIAFQQFMLALVSASDALMLGMLSQDALSAVSLAGQITFVENLFLTAMTIGLSMFAAQYWGKGDIPNVERIFAYVLKITAAVAFLFFVVACLKPAALMRIFTSDETLIAGGACYLQVVSFSYFLTGISQIYLCILKNTDRAILAGTISSVSVVMNILLNAVFIFGLFGLPKMEIAGAALATVLARVIEVLWCVLETTKKGSVCLRWKYCKERTNPLKHDFWKYTAPVLGNEIVWGGGFTMYSVIMGHVGSDAVAANSVANIVKNLIVCFCLGLGSGGGIIVGNELGAGNLDTAKEYGRKVCRLAIFSGLISGAVMLLISPLILANCNLYATSKEYLKWMLVLCAVYMVGKSVNGATIGGIFCAGGDSKFGLLCDGITMWCVTVPLGFVSAFVWKWPVLAVFLIINLDEIVKLPAVYRHYKKYLWVRDLTKP